METNNRPPLSADMLAQAETIVTGRAIVIDDELGIIEVNDPRWMIVTWSNTSAAQAAEVQHD